MSFSPEIELGRHLYPGLVSVVMPAFNEQDGLRVAVHNVAAELKSTPHEIVVVDDGSRDGTWDVIRALSEELPTVRGVRFSRNFGHMAALLAGISHARGGAVIVMDADGQHPPALITLMLSRWRSGAKVVQGIRLDQGNSAFKSWSSRAFYRLFSWLAGSPIQPGSADFRLLDRQVVDVVLKHPRPGLFMRGFVPWTGFATTFLEFAPKQRIAGTTKYSLRKMLSLARQGILRFSIKPLRLATLIGMVTCILSLAYLAYVVGVRLFTDHFVEGWASVAGVLTLLGGVQLLVMGILGEYVGMVFEAAQELPPFVVAEHVGGDVDSSRGASAPPPPPRPSKVD